MEYVLRTQNLTKQFGEKTAVKNVSMQIKKGEIYGFIGKNGAGKTTLMRLVLGAAMPTGGSIELFGGEESVNETRHRIGALLEYPCIYKNCTALENLRRFAILTGADTDELEDILDLVGLKGVGRKKAGQFSLGMKQRLAIGIALLGHPEFLVLDEPINGLDPAGIKEIRDVILALNQKKGVTFLVSSHLLDELSKIVTTYGIIKDGVLIEQITAKELEGRCRHHLKLRVVDNIPKAQALLECIADPKAVKIQDDCIYLFELLDKSDKVNRLLVRHGIKVSELSVQTASLEEYFLERMGK
ncbi:MAG: ATP-binding cassette domain-containing protein [Oscillospiraceae bacterium]